MEWQAISAAAVLIRISWQLCNRCAVTLATQALLKDPGTESGGYDA